MADAPWRCSECGTVNEPVANACRTCGRWPSLFDLQESTVEDVEELAYDDFEQPVEVDVAEAKSVEAESFEPEPFESETYEVEPSEEEAETPSQRGRRVIGSIIVPLAVVAYLVISLIVER